MQHKNRYFLAGFGVIIGVALCAFSALAQATAAPQPQLVVQSPWAEVVSSVVNAVVAIVLPIALYKFSQWSGVQIETKERDKLHSAVLTGIYLALSRFGITAVTNPDNRQALIAETLRWVNESGAPGAQAALKLSDGEVRQLIESRIGAIENVPAIAVAPAVVAPSGVAARPG